MENEVETETMSGLGEVIANVIRYSWLLFVVIVWGTQIDSKMVLVIIQALVLLVSTLSREWFRNYFLTLEPPNPQP